jgi:hypothetical protein
MQGRVIHFIFTRTNDWAYCKDVHWWPVHSYLRAMAKEVLCLNA